MSEAHECTDTSHVAHIWRCEEHSEVIFSVCGGVPVSEHGREKRLETASVSKLLKVGQLPLVGLE